MGFVANFVRFPAVKNFENMLRFDKVTESLKVGTFSVQSVVLVLKWPTCCCCGDAVQGDADDERDGPVRRRGGDGGRGMDESECERNRLRTLASTDK